MFKSKIAVGLIAAVLLGLFATTGQAASADPIEGATALVADTSQEVVDAVESSQLVAQAETAVEDATNTTAEASEEVKNRRTAMCIALLGAIVTIVCKIVDVLS